MLDSLAKNSPFGTRAADGAAAQPEALELRGVIVDGGETLFSVYDPSTRSSRWVTAGEAGGSFTVRSYDKDKTEAKVQYQGREIALKLKQATLIALAAPPPPVPGNNNPVPLNQPGTNPQAIIPASNDEATRLAAIAQEISRRRALRQQALQPKPANPPAPAQK